jgi:para-nitrobenzyl esterase
MRKAAMKFLIRMVSVVALLAFAPMGAPAQDAKPVQVNVHNFIRAETDLYFRKAAVDDGAFGKLRHRREMASIDKQDVVRMNRDTLYSSGVFDLDAGPLTVKMPDAGKRFMSMQVISQDHYTTEVVYGPGSFSYTKEKVGTRYVYVIIRTLANSDEPQDVKAANTVQDGIEVQQAAFRKFEVPNWDQASQTKARSALESLGSLGSVVDRFGLLRSWFRLHHSANLNRFDAGDWLLGTTCCGDIS